MKEDGQMGLDKVRITRGAVSGGRTVEDTRGKKVGREKRGCVCVCVCLIEMQGWACAGQVKGGRDVKRQSLKNKMCDEREKNTHAKLKKV